MSDTSHRFASNELRSVDRELLIAIRRGLAAGADSVGIGELVEALGVTATAVRQRVDRLLDMGLIDREKVVAGRGRPTYRYRLTISGYRQVGSNPTELAEAMWREILEVKNTELRERLLSSIAARMGRQYAAQLRDDDSSTTVGERMQRLSQMLAARHVVTDVSKSGELPVLDIGACPYPSLTDASEDRSMCRLEEQMFSEALGQPVQLSSCRLDGDSCCQFSP
ncbi:MAG: ArsR family transcriptional regulator, partial [Pirellulaceae bacterium]|nr:ArsR family transcriptional regulator [Pirellulaceae bacterium]